MKIGILETGEVHPDLQRAARRLSGDVRAAARGGRSGASSSPPCGSSPARCRPRRGQADAWLVTGSRHGVYDDLPWIEPLKAFLRACVAARVPVVGICFGHQILAEALGGRAVKSDRGWGLGVQDYELVARPGWMAEPARPLRGQRAAPGPGGGAAARARPCSPARRTAPIAALAYGDPEAPDAVTLQPHPEFGAGVHGRAARAARRHRLPRAPRRRPRAPRWRGRSTATPGRG